MFEEIYNYFLAWLLVLEIMVKNSCTLCPMENIYHGIQQVNYIMNLIIQTVYYMGKIYYGIDQIRNVLNILFSKYTALSLHFSKELTQK